MHSPKYRPDIDGLRAVAVLSVVAYHAFPNLVSGGFVGVDIFFVISGFLISSILLESLDKDTFSLREFYSRRVRRIFPALILVIVTTFVIGWFVLLPEEFKQLGKHIAGGGFVSNLMLWNEAGYFDSAAESKPLLHLWSLGVEEQFYIFWPLFLYFVWRRINILILITFILVGSFALNIGKVGTDSVGAFYSPFTRFWELLIGAALAYCKLYRVESHSIFNAVPVRYDGGLQSHSEVIIREVLSVVGMVLIVVGVFKLTRETVFPGWWALLPTIGAVLVMTAGGAWLNNKLLANRVVVWFGLISFPLYLWHWPMLAFARILEGSTPPSTVRLAAVFLSIIFAALTYELLERPIRFSRYRVGTVTVLCVLMMFASGSGFATYKNNGLAQRSGFEASALTNQIPPEDVSMHNQENCSLSTEYPYQKLNKDFFCMQSSEDKNLPTNVVVGDSHSYPMYFGLYDHYVKQKGERLLLLGAPGCPPFLDVESFEKGSEDRCSALMNTLLKRIESDSQVKTVILVNRGTLYVTGSGYGDVEKHNRIIRRSGASATVSNSAVYKAALSDTLRDMQSHGKHIVLVMQPPELGFEPKSCLKNRPISMSHRNLASCGLSYDSYLERTKEYRLIINEVIAGQESLIVLDPSKALCVNSYCSAYAEGRFSYSDNNHLSPSGATKVVNNSALIVQ